MVLMSPEISLPNTTHTAFGRAAGPLSLFRSLSLNERQLLGLIRREAPLSRAELARRTGLALPTISRLADQLLKDGLIAAEDKVMMGRMGQPSLPLSLATHAAYAFGVTVRPDALTVSLTHLSGQVVSHVETAHDGMTRQQTVERIGDAIDELISGAAVPADRVCGLGLALPGFFIDDPERVNAPLGMEDWATAELEQELGSKLGLPVVIENDGSAAALGEYTYGRGSEFQSFAYLYVDRGLGGGVINEGQLLRGRRGNAGEFTGMLHPELRSTRPTLNLLKQVVEEDGGACSLSDLAHSRNLSSAIVDKWIEQVLPATNAIVSAIGAIIDPDAIVIAGRLPPSIAEQLIAKLRFYSVPVRGRDRPFPVLVPSNVSGDAASLGASALCFNRTLL